MQQNQYQGLYNQLVQSPTAGTVQNIYSDLTGKNVQIQPALVQMHNAVRDSPDDPVKVARAVAAFKVFLRQLQRGARRRKTNRRKALKKRTTRRR
jgi:hypothetical protein